MRRLSGAASSWLARTPITRRPSPIPSRSYRSAYRRSGTIRSCWSARSPQPSPRTTPTSKWSSSATMRRPRPPRASTAERPARALREPRHPRPRIPMTRTNDGSWREPRRSIALCCSLAAAWFVINNDDDALRPDHVSTLLAAARDTRDEVVYGRMIYHRPDNSTLMIGEWPPVLGQFVGSSRSSIGPFGCSISAWLRRCLTCPEIGIAPVACCVRVCGFECSTGRSATTTRGGSGAQTSDSISGAPAPARRGRR